MATDLKVPVNMIEDFAEGCRARLPVEVMQALVTRLWHGHQVYNAEVNALQCANTAPSLPAPVPPDANRHPASGYDAAAIGRDHPRSLWLEKPERERIKSRAGWIDTLFR